MPKEPKNPRSKSSFLLLPHIFTLLFFKKTSTMSSITMDRINTICATGIWCTYFTKTFMQAKSSDAMNICLIDLLIIEAHKTNLNLFCTAMPADISIILSITNAQSDVRSIVMLLIDQLNSAGLSHEIMLIYALDNQDKWQEIESICQSYKAVKAFHIIASNGIESQQLCGVMHAKAKFALCITDDFKLQSKQLLMLYKAISKSNCELVYGYFSGRTQAWLAQKLEILRRAAFRLFSGLSAYRSSVKIFRLRIAQNLSVKTPYYFLFDKLIQHRVNNDSYVLLKQPKKKRTSKPKKYSYRSLVHLIAYSYFGEFLAILLLSFNIVVLLQAKLFLAFYMACASTVIIWLIYLYKWRRRIAYTVLNKIGF